MGWFALFLRIALTSEELMGWTATADIPADFERAHVQLCRDLSTPGAPCHPIDLAKCWNSESGVSHRALNSGGWAAGIFQLMPSTARGLGWRRGDPRWDEAAEAAKRQDWGTVSRLHEGLMREFTALSATDQLEWARLFYGAHRGSLTSPAHCYVTTFLPAELPFAGDPQHVLCAEPGRHPAFPHGKYPDAYEANHRAFDKMAKGWIEVRDLTARMDLVATGPRWDEIEQRIVAAQCSGDVDLDSVDGIQCALSRLGFDVGPQDGHYGPRTQAAVRAFQTERGLATDGIVGPITKMALQTALNSAA